MVSDKAKKNEQITKKDEAGYRAVDFVKKWDEQLNDLDYDMPSPDDVEGMQSLNEALINENTKLKA